MSLVKAKSKVDVSSKKKGRGRAPKGRSNGGNPPPKKLKMKVESDDEEDKADVKAEEEESFQQSYLVSGGTLKDYQLEGVAWMATLWENGISGILGTFFSHLGLNGILIKYSGRDGIRKGK